MIVGGQYDNVFYSDLFAYDISDLKNHEIRNRWEELESLPVARTNHTTVTWNEKLYL